MIAIPRSITGMTDLSSSPPPPASSLPPVTAPARADASARRGGAAWVWLLLLAAIAAAAWFWYDGQRRERLARMAAADSAQRLQALESRIDGLRRDTRSHAQRLQQADATNRVLRDELLGISQRSTILEDQVAKLADASRQGAQALRLEETELLLTAAEQRLALSADLEGARRAYALAAGVLDGIDAPGMLNLRQTLAQERADLDALKADPARTATAQLDAFAAALPQDEEIAQRRTPARSDAPWWERMFSKLVTVAPADPTLAVSGEERSAGFLALELELTLARAAIERRDDTGYRAALARAESWLPRLWPDSPQRRARQAELVRLRALPLRLSLPTLGSTLAQLRGQRETR
jgi:uroporphyrin-III C-methyltransferase